MDLIGPFKTTPSGNNYVLTVTDYFTKWTEAVPIKSKDALSVAVGLRKIYLRYGAPHRIITDNGKEFSNQVR
jgi:IS30 family transposase